MKKLLVILFVLFSTSAYAQNVSTTQMQLKGATQFVNRVAYLMGQYATTTVKPEALATICHISRSAYANNVITDPVGVANSAVIILAGSTNVIGTVTTIAGNIDSSASDASLLAQIATLWNALSKCDTGS